MVYRQVLFILILSVNVVHSQSSRDSAFVQQTLDSTITLYLESFGENTLLYNGREYTGNYARTVGHPFYASDQPQKGSIVYNHVLYPHPAISYDLTNDEVFIKSRQNKSIKLLNEKIDQFSIGNHIFVHIRGQKEGIGGLEAGFYEVLSNEVPKVLAKRKKQLVPSFNLDDPYRFVDYDRFFLEKNNQYLEVTTEASLLSALTGSRKEIKKYMRNKKLNYKSNPEYTIIVLAQQFGRIKKQ